MIEEGYDLMFRTAPLPSSGLTVRPLTSWRHILCCSPAYLENHPPIHGIGDLADHNCLQYEFYPFGRDWRFEGLGGKPESVRVRGNFRTSSSDALRMMAIRGQGILIAPSFLIADDIAAGTLVHLLPDIVGVELSITAIYPTRRQLSAKVRCFLDLLVERFRSHETWLHPDKPTLIS
jgi:DNA-binding transcriptional LysR family regulator